MKTLLFILAFVAVFQISCKKSEKNTTTNSNGYTPNCSSTKSFSAEVFPLINASCNTSGCHTDYSNHTQISADKASIRTRVLNGSMPKNSSLTSVQKNVIICWIDAGAPNN